MQRLQRACSFLKYTALNAERVTTRPGNHSVALHTCASDLSAVTARIFPVGRKGKFGTEEHVRKEPSDLDAITSFAEQAQGDATMFTT